MHSLRKWFFKPKKEDTSKLASFYWADEELTMVSSELDSFDGRTDPDRCSILVAQLRLCQDKVLSICSEIMDEVIPNMRANRDFRVKFPDDVLHENLAGQLWFGAECLAAGSNIIHRELESASMRPLAKALTRALDNVRSLLREQALRNSDIYPDKLKESLRIFDRLFAEFELSYVTAMVPIKSAKEYHLQQEIIVLFSETLMRSLKTNLVTQDMVDDYDPSLMFTIPRLAIVWGLILFPDGPFNIDREADNVSELFRPFRSLLMKIRDLLWTLTKRELITLEKMLCSQDEPKVSDANEEVHENFFSISDEFLKLFSQKHKKCKEFVEDFYLHNFGTLSDETDANYKCSQGSQEHSIKPSQNKSTSINSTVNSSPVLSFNAHVSETVNNNIKHMCTLPNFSTVCSSCSYTVDDGPHSLPLCNNFLQEAELSYSANSSDSLPVHNLCSKIVHSSPRHRRSPARVPSKLPCRLPQLLNTMESNRAHNSVSNLDSLPIVCYRASLASPLSSSLPLFTMHSHSSKDSKLRNLSHIAHCHKKLNRCQSQLLNNNHRRFFQRRSRSQLGNANDITLERKCLSQLNVKESSQPISVPERDSIDEPNCANTYSSCTSCQSVSTLSSPEWDSTSPETSSFNSECQDDEEIALALQAAEIASRNKVRARFKSSQDLMHKLFVCISGVADQLQTNYACDLRNILKTVFDMNCSQNMQGSGSSSTLSSDCGSKASSEEGEDKMQCSDSRRVSSSAEQSSYLLSSPESPLRTYDDNDRDLMSIDSAEDVLIDTSLILSIEEQPENSENRDNKFQPVWIPDELVSQCMSCNIPFTMLRRRHHCRNCGKIFCSHCSSNSIPLPHYGHLKPVRVCNPCFAYIITASILDQQS